MDAEVRRDCKTCVYRFCPRSGPTCEPYRSQPGYPNYKSGADEYDRQERLQQLQKQQFNGREEVLDPPKAVADGAGGGVKADTGKPPLGLLPRSALLAEAEVVGFGAKKYEPHNWRLGMKWSRLADASLRHLLAWIDGEDVDPETGLSHLAHLRSNAGFLIEYQQKGLGEDDRYRAV